MNVDKSNFEAVFETYVRPAIASADFIAFDCEMSGVRRPDEPSGSAFDRVQDRFAVAAKAASTFQLLQYGICTARWCDAEARFELFPFAFTIFPSPLVGEEQLFGVQASSFAFLANNHFDFNAWVRQGIPFLSHFHERRLRQRGHGAASADAKRAKLDKDEKREPVTLSDKDEAWLTSFVLPKLDEWLAAGATADPLALPPANGWRRLICHQEIPKRRPLLETDSAGVDAAKHIIVRLRVDEAAAAALEQAKDDAKEAALVAEIGARRVFDLVCARGVPVVGHNAMLDLLFTTHAFHDGPPATADEFAVQLQQLYPAGVFDTKRIASTLPALADADTDTQLEPLFNAVRQHAAAPAFALHPAVGQMGAAHNAGFDAYMTAVVFASLHAIAKGTDPSAFEAARGEVTLFRLATPFRINSDAARADLEDARLAANLVYVFDFPQAWSTADLKKAFGNDARVTWNSDSSAFVKLSDSASPSAAEWVARGHTEHFKVLSLQEMRTTTPPLAFAAVNGYAPVAPTTFATPAGAAASSSSSSHSGKKRSLTASLTDNCVVQ